MSDNKANVIIFCATIAVGTLLLFGLDMIAPLPRRDQIKDTTRIQLSYIVKQVNYIRLRVDSIKNNNQTDSITLNNDKWLHEFKREFPWIDNRIKEDDRVVE